MGNSLAGNEPLSSRHGFRQSEDIGQRYPGEFLAQPDGVESQKDSSSTPSPSTNLLTNAK